MPVPWDLLGFKAEYCLDSRLCHMLVPSFEREPLRPSIKRNVVSNLLTQISGSGAAAGYI